ncbi:hypothetical protein SELMODRAFT_406998 [Selaginella moellendorffii]|uniref:Zinc finger CCCH domain-containing protein 1 n=1 Tax=Selaginella moellendorffii TaxID=88036 RepID=D8R3K9_SELML|nr:zinc finger CCCH domain-containing protein 1 [Selaginella moellendorffii]EFJ32962.1 hypothetical protein SELMODRAFT_406998 [Selaginella moellendorffii]|eukprot:XP_002965542.1 zinc finger CCCH domain-containing protein 1 [Selaginella moellendorffii]
MATEEATAATNCTFFKKPPKNRNLRKRPQEEEAAGDGAGSGSDEEKSAVVHKPKAPRKGGFTTGVAQRSGADEAAAAGAGSTSKNTFFYESSKEIQAQDSYATAALETETEFDKDARALREKVLQAAAKRIKSSSDPFDATTNKEKGEDKGEKKPAIYKGLNAYTDHRAGFRRENSIASEKAGGAHGPLRAASNVRMSVRFDYQPDVCKDYKETGYCGYGDSCKYLHDRGDYKSGWQLERDWEEAQREKKERLMRGIKEMVEGKEEDEEEDDELPFACFICRESFVNPVVTACKHYFCESCALEHYKKNKSCFVCNKPTNGLFNTAHIILKKLRKP